MGHNRALAWRRLYRYLIVRKPAPVRETLDFPIPSASHLSEFDEIKVVFHRSAERLDKSARIAIERFLLMPI